MNLIRNIGNDFILMNKNCPMLSGKKILITGGTGSLGQALTKKLLLKDVEIIRIFSRDELKQTEMEKQFDDDRLRFLIGDVRDKPRLDQALENIDVVIHAAALKQIPVIEYNPFEGVKTNVYGTQNLIDACIYNDVEIAVAIGTDKAVSPFNTYGATKLLMEKLFISSNSSKGYHRTIFTCVRYGNVLGSRGSLVPMLVNQIKSGKKITITDPSMTRFNITMTQAVDLIFRALNNTVGGDIFVPKLKAYNVGDIGDVIKELLNSNTETEIISVRKGEKFHELLISKDEIRNTFENEQDYVVFNQILPDSKILEDAKISKTNLSDQYSSDLVELLTKDELKEILQSEHMIN